MIVSATRSASSLPAHAVARARFSSTPSCRCSPDATVPHAASSATTPQVVAHCPPIAPFVAAPPASSVARAPAKMPV
ncbi:MAG: hypothetical protein IPO88_29710 [Nannocystis sp.]|uniref:hypothetical protein n=1 Tax=Nannocystis sp. TaxID=1962667 RepID=UPI002427856A|nr:hypothetical protein [Nannocystis sp.]MBK9757609.1 hypothetical protein [Nannocystis sp.]